MRQNNHTTKIINWKDYNKALKRRGDFTVLINIAALSKPKKKHRSGHPEEYSDELILLLAELREFMQSRLRQTIGFAEMLMNLAGLEVKIPHYSTLSRRMSKLHLSTALNKTQMRNNVIMLVDSTGFKTHGEGEWKVRKHGAGYRRGWVKLHIGVSHQNRQIIAAVVTDEKVADSTTLAPLLKQAQHNLADRTRGHYTPKIAQVIGDGAYDGLSCYQAVEGKRGDSGINLLVPPPKNAVWRGILRGDTLIEDERYKTRNKYVGKCMVHGRKQWKRDSGYHKRSIVETEMYRLKTAFSDKLKSRSRVNQEAEIAIRIMLMNVWTNYGLPQYANVAA